MNVLKGFLIDFEEDLQSGGNSRGLDLAPETTFVTSDTIHNTTDVSEVLFELLLDNLISA